MRHLFALNVYQQTIGKPLLATDEPLNGTKRPIGLLPPLLRFLVTAIPPRGNTISRFRGAYRVTHFRCRESLFRLALRGNAHLGRGLFPVI